MAQSKRFFDDVKKEIECPVCQEQFSETKEPKLLKCFHTFCKSCLEGWLRQQGGGALSCPKCRRITECPKDDINSLPSNLFYKQMVDIVEAYSAQGQEDSPCCGNCDERKSLKFYCADCNHFLCEDCTGAHKKMKTLSGHQVKEIGKFKAGDARDYARRANACKQHNDEVRFFCEQCKTCICRDCAILDHEDHKKMSLERGLEEKKSEIEVKLREVQVNGSRLSSHKESLEKRRLKVNNCFEQATKEVREATECYINLIRRHEESVTERLMRQKESFEDEFVNKLASVDGKLAEIGSSLEFGDEVLSRNNLPEILNVEEMLEKRLQELSIPFEPMLNFPEIRYTPNDMSSLTDALGNLHTTNTEPSLSVAEGQGLTEAIQGECSTFTVITKDAHNQTTYSDIDEIEVTILSEEKETLKTIVTDCKNGQYLVKYKSDVGGDFNVSISVRGQAIMGSPFNLAVYVAKKTKKVVETVLQKKQEFEEAALVVEQFEESINKDNHDFEDDLEAVLEIFGKEEIEIKRESGKDKGTGEFQVSSHGEEAICVDPPDSSRGSQSKDTLETYIGGVKVSVYKGDLTSERVDVIVSAANNLLRHDGGVSKAILDKGGKVIQAESNRIIAKRGTLKDGEAVVTTSGFLSCKKVVHAVGPVFREVGLSQSRIILRRACLNSLILAQESKMTSIALPAMGSGACGMPKDECAKVMFDAVEEFVKQGKPKKKRITDIRFVNTDDPSVKAFRTEFISRYGNSQDHSNSKKLTGGRSDKVLPKSVEGATSSSSDRGKNENERSSNNDWTTKHPSDVVSSKHYNAYGSTNASAGHPKSGSNSLPFAHTSYSGAVKNDTGEGTDAISPTAQEPGGKGKMGFTFPFWNVTDRENEDSAVGGASSTTECPICLDTVTNARTLKCNHVFCTDCVETALKHDNRCPVCKEVQGVMRGNQPEGQMQFHKRREWLPGYNGCGTIVINYFFPSGIQGKEHPNPGRRYESTGRTAYLPDNQEGNEVLHLLGRAFEAGLVFTVGTSVTTGLQNQITWNDIHHKTNVYGGPQGFGYPDPDYLRRVKEDLAAKGIR